MTCVCRSFLSLSETKNTLVVIPGLKPLGPEELHTEMLCLWVSSSRSALECAEFETCFAVYIDLPNK